MSNITQLKCGDNLRRTIFCNNKTERLSVLRCYCIAYSSQWPSWQMFNNMHLGSGQKASLWHKHLQANSSATINAEVCLKVKREGQLCGKCIEGHFIRILFSV